MRRYPVTIGRSSRVAEAGDFFFADASTSVPIIASRQASLKTRLNICRHRGTRVSTEASGHPNNLVCQYS
jgi:hypothetical protein